MKKDSVDNSDLEYQFSGVEPPNVIPFIGKAADFKEDIDNLDKWLAEAKPWSEEKTHYLFLAAQICKNAAIPLEVRRLAAFIISKHSDTRAITDEVLGVDIVSEVQKALGLKRW